MRELRKMTKKVNKYLVLIYYNPEKAKSNCSIYFNDVQLLRKEVNSYIDKTANSFKKACDISVKVWDISTSNIFSKVVRSIAMIIVNNYLSRYSYELFAAGILQRNLEPIIERFEQFRHLT